MNTIFDINRFGHLLRRNARNSIKQIIYIVIALVGLYVFFIISNLAYENIFDVSVIAAFVVVCSPFMLEKSINKQRNVFDFILPVSTLEHFLYLFFKHTIVIPLVCLGIVFIFQPILINVADDNLKWIFFNPKDIWQYQHFFWVLGIQSISYLCYLYFKKYMLVKSMIVFLIMLVLPQYIASFALIINNIPTVNFNVTELFTPSDFIMKWSGSVESLVVVCDVVFKIIFPFGLWIVAYRKLKETEI